MEGSSGFIITIGIILLVALWVIGGSSISNGIIMLGGGSATETASASTYSDPSSHSSYSNSNYSNSPKNNTANDSVIRLYESTHQSQQDATTLNINNFNQNSYINQFYYPSNGNYTYYSPYSHSPSQTPIYSNYYSRPNSYVVSSNNYSQF